jgi:hypothetical protein
MELRTVFILSLVVLIGAPLRATPVKRYPLDDRRVYALHVSTAAPTTIIFPGPVTALDGAGVSVRPEDNPGILVSHQAGSAFFSVRALQEDASGAINVIYQNRVYALTFTTDREPDRTLTFDEPVQGEARIETIQLNPDRLLSLLDRARNFAAIAQHYPALTQSIERITPGTTTTAGNLTITIEEVLRFEAEDALVFQIRLENHGDQPLNYAPTHLAVQIADTVFPVTLTDATGVVPANQATVIAVVIVGQSGTRQAHLSIKNTFSLLVPILE